MTDSNEKLDGVQPSGGKKQSVVKEIISWILTFAIAIGLGLSVRTFVVEPVRIKGPSMNTTLKEGELILLNRIGYIIGEPQRGDIINFHCVGYNERLVKRIIALPGDTVQIESGVVYVNGQEIDDSYAIHGTDDYPLETVPEGSYFVMGDNRPQSADSRLSIVGYVERKYIYGKIWGILYPFEKWQFSDLNVPH